MTESISSTDQTKNWDQTVAGRLDQSVEQVDFFQAIRRVEENSQDFPRVGHANQVDQDAIRIRQSAELDFAAATINRIDSRHDGRAIIDQRFFGLLGPSGPMPLTLTEQARHESRHENDPTMESFLNIFHHRLATLFYRAWCSSRGAVQRDRPTEDRYAALMSALSGVMRDNHPGSASERNVSEETRIHFSGRFASSRRNAEGLSSVVSATLRARVLVHSFVLRYLRLQPEDRTTLSTQSSALGRGGRLGRSAVLGRSVPDRRSTVGLEIGPINLRLFQSLLPGGELHQTLAELIRGYIDPSVECRIRLVLNRVAVPRMSLGKSGTLGRNAWIHSSPPQHDVGDCQFFV